MQKMVAMLILMLIILTVTGCATSGSEFTGKGQLLHAPPLFTVITYWIVMTVQALGVLIIVIGFLNASVSSVVQFRKPDRPENLYEMYRQKLGRSVLLGLEFLLAASVISTVAIAPSFRNVGVLGLIILLRSFLSMMLDMDLYGKWPWERKRYNK